MILMKLRHGLLLSVRTYSQHIGHQVSQATDLINGLGSETAARALQLAKESMAFAGNLLRGDLCSNSS